MAQPSRYPQYLPFPSAIQRDTGEYSVPNRASVDWPQAQFAPPWLKAGSPSCSPYRYEADGPLSRFEPSMYSGEVSALGPTREGVPVSEPSALGAFDAEDSGMSGKRLLGLAAVAALLYLGYKMM